MYLFKKKFFKILLIVNVILIFVLSTGSALACNIAIATGKATKDGSVILAKASNRPNEECQWMVSYPGGEHQDGETVKCTWLEIPQAPVTYAVRGGQMHWQWGFEQGMNEFGVAAGNVAVHYRNGTPEASHEALTGMDILRLALERSKTAAEAVQTMIDLYEQYGQHGATSATSMSTYCNAYGIADSNEAWVLELPPNGYIAYKIPDGETYAVQNISMIESEYDIIAPNIIPDAIEAGWHEEGEEFNFAFSYMAGDDYDGRCAIKLDNLNYLLKEGYGNIDPAYMMEILRDRREDNWLSPRFLPHHFYRNMDETSPGASTAHTMVAHLRKDLPESIANVYWFAMASTNTSPFSSLYWGGQVPEEYNIGGTEFDPNSPWWIYDVLDRMSRKNHDVFTNVVRSVWKPVEEQNFRQANMIEKEVINLINEGKTDEIEKLLSDFHRSEMEHQLNIAKGTAKALQELHKVYPGQIIGFYDYDSSNIQAGLMDLFEMDLYE